MRARLARGSTTHPRRRLSRQEVADAANAILAKIHLAKSRRPGRAGLTAGYVGALERGEIRWPNDDYRRALRTFYGASDTDLGFYIDRPDGASARAALASAQQPALTPPDRTTDQWHALVPPDEPGSWNHGLARIPVHNVGGGVIAYLVSRPESLTAAAFPDIDLITASTVAPDPFRDAASGEVPTRRSRQLGPSGETSSFAA